MRSSTNLENKSQVKGTQNSNNEWIILKSGKNNDRKQQYSQERDSLIAEERYSQEVDFAKRNAAQKLGNIMKKNYNIGKIESAL